MSFDTSYWKYDSEAIMFWVNDPLNMFRSDGNGELVTLFLLDNLPHDYHHHHHDPYKRWAIVNARQCMTQATRAMWKPSASPATPQSAKRFTRPATKSIHLLKLPPFLLLSSGSALQCTMKSVESATRRATRQSMTKNAQPPMSSLATM